MPELIRKSSSGKVFRPPPGERWRAARLGNMGVLVREQRQITLKTAVRLLVLEPVESEQEFSGKWPSARGKLTEKKIRGIRSRFRKKIRVFEKFKKYLDKSWLSNVADPFILRLEKINELYIVLAEIGPQDTAAFVRLLKNPFLASHFLNSALKSPKEAEKLVYLIKQVGSARAANLFSGFSNGQSAVERFSNTAIQSLIKIATKTK
ncbi:MAG TPA: hypothetical protein VFF13_02575 [archaeon]|nr:hypothetical protein [archaeon]